MKQLINIAVVLLVLSAAIYGQKKDYSAEPGYVDFGSFQSLETGEMVAEVMIEEHLLKMVAKLSKHEDEQLFNLLKGLKLVRVNVFGVTEENEKLIQEKIKKINDKLVGSSWDSIVKYRDKGESANVYIKTSGDDTIVGLVVASFEKNGEAAFVNIVGDIDLETIGRLSEKFDVPGLDKVH